MKTRRENPDVVKIGQKFRAHYMKTLRFIVAA